MDELRDVLFLAEASCIICKSSIISLHHLIPSLSLPFTRGGNPGTASVYKRRCAGTLPPPERGRAGEGVSGMCAGLIQADQNICLSRECERKYGA